MEINYNKKKALINRKLFETFTRLADSNLLYIKSADLQERYATVGNDGGEITIRFRFRNDSSLQEAIEILMLSIPTHDKEEGNEAVKRWYPEELI